LEYGGKYTGLSQGRKLLKDVGSNYIIYGLQLCLSVVAIPIYLTAYGDELYGVYLLSMGLASSLLFLEFGSGKALVRYVAEYKVDGEEEKYGLALKTCSVITMATSVLVGLIFVAVAFARETVFNIPPDLLDEAFWLLIGAGVYSFLLLIAQLSQAMLKGGGIFFKRNLLSVWQLVVQVLLIVLVRFFDMPIYGLMVGMSLTLLLSVFLDLRVLLRDAGELLRFDLAAAVPSRSTVGGEVWEYAKGTFYISGTAFFSQNVDQLVIAFFLDVRFVVVYAIITKPYQILKSLLSKAYVIFQPHYVRIKSKFGYSRLGSFVKETGKVSSIILAAAVGVAALWLPMAIELWIGSDVYAEYVIYGQLVLMMTIVRSLTTMTFQAMYILGETKSLFRLETVLVGINFVSSLVLVQFFGVGGVILGTVAQLLLSVPAIERMSQKKLRGQTNNSGDWGVTSSYLFAVAYSLMILCASWQIESSFVSTSPAKILTLTIGSITLLGILALIFYKWLLKSKRATSHYF
jgi:O-antigen/teichoic acid export membrane protein